MDLWIVLVLFNEKEVKFHEYLGNADLTFENKCL